jgi:hypothetical protein
VSAESIKTSSPLQNPSVGEHEPSTRSPNRKKAPIAARKRSHSKENAQRNTEPAQQEEVVKAVSQEASAPQEPSQSPVKKKKKPAAQLSDLSTATSSLTGLGQLAAIRGQVSTKGSVVAQKRTKVAAKRRVSGDVLGSLK